MRKNIRITEEGHLGFFVGSKESFSCAKEITVKANGKLIAICDLTFTYVSQDCCEKTPTFKIWTMVVQWMENKLIKY